jgi:DNA/RNA-binding domain of Phe-tRNA-synthetase-like protein
MASFQYHPDIIDRFPDLTGGVILVNGLTNGPTSEALREAYLAEQAATIKRIGDTPLSELEPLAAWRSAFRAFGVNPTKYRSATEALLRRLTKKGDIPCINSLVDLCNMISIRYAIPIAALETRDVQGPITVHFADGSEPFKPLGQPEVEYPESGEVVFTDEKKMVVARRWCWRQSDESAANPNTQNAIITIEAQHPGGRAVVEAAMADVLALLGEHVGGDCTSDILGPGNPAI